MPGSPERAAEVLRCAAREHLTLLPIGCGSKLAWGSAPERVDLLLSSARLCGIVAYEPADGTLTARAGSTLAELADAAREHHHVSPEVPRPENATLGGTLAAGASGLDRLRFGPARHQVLGLTVLLADGKQVKSGGRVVKNVTGYDLHRLWCGSRGTLCSLLEATLRLQPRPAEEIVLRAAYRKRAAALGAAEELARSPLRPLAVVLRSHAGEGWELVLVLAGRAEVVRFELEGARKILGSAEVFEGDDAARERRELRALELAGTEGWPPLWVACRPSRLPGVLDRMDAAAGAQGRAPHPCHPLLASVAARFSPPLDGPDAGARSSSP
jgi:glycolate oxidase FAD binding subunit